MTNKTDTRGSGRKLDAILRVRALLGGLHLVLGALALFVANCYLMAARWNDWWFAPIRALHKGNPIALLGLPSFVPFLVFVLPTIPYAVSWMRVRDSILGNVTGAKFLAAACSYTVLFLVTSLASDWFWLEAISPPLNIMGVLAVPMATVPAFYLIADLVGRIFAKEQGEVFW